MVGGLHVESDLLALVVASRSSNLGSVQGGDVALDSIWVLSLEVDIVNGELVVEPLNLAVNLVFWNPGAGFDESLDYGTR